MTTEVSNQDFNKKKLVQDTLSHLIFLKKAHEYFNSRNVNLKCALKRYLSKWVPFLAKAKTLKKVVVPMDIAWMWHVHRLCPTSHLKFLKGLEVQDDAEGMQQASRYLVRTARPHENETEQNKVYSATKALLILDTPGIVFNTVESLADLP